jgi:hypothetical protein
MCSRLFFLPVSFMPHLARGLNIARFATEEYDG